MISRRSFLRVLGLGVLAGPTLVRAALKPSEMVVGWDPATGTDFACLVMASRDAQALASGEVNNFMGFAFVRTELKVPEPLSAKQIRESIASGQSLDERINSRYQRPLINWRWVRRPAYVEQHLPALDELLIDVPQVTPSMLADVRTAIRRAWSGAWS